MSFNPSLATPRDRIRLQVGDTSGDPATELLPDDTYDATFAYHGNDEVKALIAMAEALIAKYSQAASRINLGDMEFSWRDRMTAWKGILEKFSVQRSADAGRGGFQVLRPRREELNPGEYERPSLHDIGEPWFNEPPDY